MIAMDKANLLVSLARGLIYIGALLLCGARAAPFAPVLLLALVALEAVRRWRWTARHGAAWAALIDLALTADQETRLGPDLEKP